MTDTLWWITGGTFGPGSEAYVLRAAPTLALALLVVIGYAVIAVNWYAQVRLASAPAASLSLKRLRGIAISSACCAAVFAFTDISWSFWRLYDVALLALACHTWWFILRMRGIGLVAERLARVDELERSARHYREVAEFLPHVVWTADAAGHVDYANLRWRDYAGESRTWLQCVHPDDRQSAHAWWTAAVTAVPPAAVSRELRLADRAGSYRAFVVHATPLVDRGATRWFGACADVDDHRRAAAEQEEQARQKAFFFNALSHDLRAPLNNVVLNAHLLKMSGPNNPDLNSTADVVVENAVAAGDLLGKLLEFARSGSDTQNELATVQLDGLLRQVERRFLPLATAKGLYFRLHVDRPVSLVTDRVKLERVVSNLVDNATKFTTTGGVTLSLTCTDDRAVISIRDTGPGIPERHVPHLFDAFYQAQNPEHDRKKGFGMGLAICKTLARQLGGDVVLAETGTAGTRFEALLPVEKAAPLVNA